MKKILIFICALTGLLLFSATASADSPLTSTPFSSAYEDIPIVKKAADEGIVNVEIAQYLADENNQIDVKAAVINALSWDFNGKTNADTYCMLIYNTQVKDLDIESLSGDQQFCIGYMMALDDYFNTDKALEILKSAEEKIPDSFTVSMIRALVESMDLVRNEWKINIEPVMQNNNLKMDMRQEAVDIITDYMVLYDTTSDIPDTGYHSMEYVYAAGAMITVFLLLMVEFKLKKQKLIKK